MGGSATSTSARGKGGISSMNTLATAEIETRLQAILSELLLLKPEDVQSGSLLVDDLDVDSIALLELAFTIERDFGVPFPDIKASEETFTMLLPDALQKLEAMPGGTTFFEYVKEEAIRRMLTSAETVAELAAVLAVPVPSGLRAEGALATTRIRDLWQAGLASPDEADGRLLDRPLGEALVTHRTTALISAETREKLFRMLSVPALTEAVGGRIPAGIDQNATLSGLRLSDLLRFLTVRTMAGYIVFLLATRENGADG